MGPLLCAAVSETLSLSGVSGLEQGFFLLNASIYLFIHLVAYLIIRNTRITCLAVFLVVLGFSVANHYVIAFTGIPITFGDLMASAGVGMSVAGGYTYALDAQVVQSLSAALVYVIALLVIPRSKLRVNSRKQPDGALPLWPWPPLAWASICMATKKRGVISTRTNGIPRTPIPITVLRQVSHRMPPRLRR